MQQIFYEHAPYAVLYYPKSLIAYNSDKWEGWVPYPGEDGSGRAVRRQHRHLRAGPA